MVFLKITGLRICYAVLLLVSSKDYENIKWLVFILKNWNEV